MSLNSWNVRWKPYSDRSMKRSGRLCVLLVAGTLATFVAFVSLSSHTSLLLRLAGGLEHLSSCTSCVGGILTPLKALAEIGDGAFTRVLVDGCLSLRIQPPDVCIGALESQGPIIAHSLRSINLAGDAAALLCAKCFDLCDSETIRPWRAPTNKPKAERPVKKISTGRKPIQVVHISDLHVDPRYHIGSEADCGRPMCCRTATTDVTKIKRPARVYGERNCDSPLVLFDSMLRAVNRYATNASLAVLTGDIVDHAVWLSSERDTIDAVKQTYALMQDRLAMPVFGAIGNHDTSPTNSFPRDTSQTLVTSDWVMRLHADVWRPYIGEEPARQLVERFSGSYSVLEPRTGARVIHFNSNYAYAANFWLYDSDRWQPDPNNLLAWLARELQAAEDAGESVWLIGHISGAGTMPAYSSYFDQILQRYHATIAFQMFGHTHRSEFEVSYSDWMNRTAENAISVTMIGPGLTPSSGNPAFVVYDVDPDTYEIMDAVTYWANFDEARYQDGPNWRRYFSAREIYGHLLRPPWPRDRPLNPAFWHRVTELFERDEEAFRSYFLRVTTGYVTRSRRVCGDVCRRNVIHELRSGIAVYGIRIRGGAIDIDSVEEGRGRLEDEHLEALEKWKDLLVAVAQKPR